MPFRYYNKSHYTLPKYAYFESLEELDEWSKNISRFRPFEDVLPYRPRSISVLDDEIDHRSPGSKGKLLVCHDYKGGYTESPFELAYTFQYWHTCDVFIYFSHHRVTVPPPGWTTAAHRQGVKMLGTLIFEHDEAKPDCLRLLVGQLPKSPTGPASPIQSSPTSSLSLPLSPHYARLLAQLAAQRGFDGYLLNFECPLLQGGVEQTRVLAAWITLLKKELRDKVGMHAEVVWYDSVIFTGHLAWQDRLNSLNLPFFLSSDSIFTNYTWRPTYPNLTAQYFLSLSSALTANKTLRDIYMGIDVWGRGSHGAGSFGSYRALQHISPSSLGLSVAIFGQAWTWESEQDKDEWTWEKWWDYERLLWAGPRTVIPKSKGIVSETESLPTRDKSSGRKDEEDEEETIPIPEMPRPEGTLPCECTSTPYKALSTFFTRKVPPNPAKGIPFHTTFCPGAGRGWWVDGRKVYDVFEASENRDKATEKFRGWTDVHKQTSMGDLLWPSPRVVDTTPGVDDDEGVKETGMKSRSKVVMDQAWNGGSSVRVLTVLSLDDGKRDQAETEEEEESILQFRSFRLPVQSLGVSRGRVYETRVVYKLETGGEEEADEVEKDVGISVARLGSNYEDGIKTFAVPTTNESGLDSQANGWTKLAIRFVVDDADAGASINEEKDTLISLGLSVSVIVSSSASKSVRIPILLGQINVYALPTSTTTLIPAASSAPEPECRTKLLWADFKRSALSSSSSSSSSSSWLTGTLAWETATSLYSSPLAPIQSAEDPIAVWPTLGLEESFSSPTEFRASVSTTPAPSGLSWFLDIMYTNVYAQVLKAGGNSVANPEAALWIGTSGYGYEGRKNEFEVMEGVFEVLTPGTLTSESDGKNGKNAGIPSVQKGDKVRFYVQGVTERGEVLGWDRSVWVEIDV